MENFDYKEKALCALRNNIEDITVSSSENNIYANFKGVGFIELWKRSLYKNIEIEVKSKTWWGKEITKIIEDKSPNGYKYTVEVFGEDYEITEEEFNEVLELKKEQLILDKQKSLMYYVNKRKNI